MTRTAIIILSVIAFLIPEVQGQNYFTGELFDAYEWDLKSINNIDLKLESDLVLRRRLLSKKEERIGDRVKENKQYYDEVIIKRYNDLEVVRIRDNTLEVKFPKRSDFTLLFGPDNRDDENYVLIVKEMKGSKGVTDYNGLVFRVQNGSRLVMGKLKRKKLPPPRNEKRTAQWNGNGTGVLIDTKGYVITNYHVVKDASEIVISGTQYGNIDLRAEVVMKDEANDLAILKITDKNYQASKREIPYSFAKGIQDVGTRVFTLGYPMALSDLGKEIKFTEGSVSSKTGYKDNISTYQISVPVQAGNSGGPLFNMDGNLVGIVSSKVVGAAVENVSYAIKTSYVKTLIESANDELSIPSGAIGGSLEFLIKQLDDFVFMIKVD